MSEGKKRIRFRVAGMLAACVRRSGLLKRLLHAVLDHGDSALLRETLLHEDARRLRALLSESDHQLLRKFLSESDHRLLRLVLFENDLVLLRSFLFEKEYRLFGKLAAEKNQEALRAVLVAQDFRLLDAVLRFDNRRVLMHALRADGFALYREASLKDHAAALAALLATDEGLDALQSVFRQDGGERLADLLRRQDFRPLRELLESRHGRVLLEFLKWREGSILRRLLVDHDLLPEIMDNEPNRGAIALETMRRRLEKLFARSPGLEARFAQARREIRSEDHLRGRFLDAVMDGDAVQLAQGVMRVPDRAAFWSLLHEILLYEDYYFACDTDAPRIIDCGAHVGMAIYYFKTLYPQAKVTAFEPVPQLRALAESNMALNGFTDVEILPFALSERRETRTFFVSDSYSMAGSLADRREAAGDTVHTIEVECVPLSAYLQEPVHYLKIDIEGAEDAVLTEAGPWLHNVQHIFCEYHHGLGLAYDRLARILTLLDRAGFEVVAGKSFGYQESSRHRPMSALGGPASEVLWAKNRRWSGAG